MRRRRSAGRSELRGGQGQARACGRDRDRRLDYRRRDLHRHDIEALVESLGHGSSASRAPQRDGRARPQKRPGLILAYIQLADGSSGLDAVNELLASFEVPVIFITAYPERFLTGQRPEPAFLIAKPFQLAVVSAVASQALFFGRKARPRERQATA
jgi:DNA-binding LytR/AlgR family response regulator